MNSGVLALRGRPAKLLSYQSTAPTINTLPAADNLHTPQTHFWILR